MINSGSENNSTSATDVSEDDSEEQPAKKATHIDISKVSYKRRSNAHVAPQSAFYTEASRLACNSKTSFREVQSLAKSSVQDSVFEKQPPTKGSMLLASLGGFGRHPQNCERDFHRFQKRVQKAHGVDIELLHVPITMDHPKVGLQPHRVAFMCPHEMMAYLYGEPAAWTHAIQGGDPDLDFGSFWQHYADTNAEWYMRHPVSTLPAEERARTIPLGLHGDDVHVYKTSARFKVMAMQWNSLMAHKLGSLLSRFCMFMLPYDLMAPGTLNEALEVISWSLQACFRGEWPMFDHKGEVPQGRAKSMMGHKIAGGYRMALCQIRGDMKFLKELFVFKSSYAHNNCCHRCVASKTIPRFSFMNVSLPFAEWLHNLYTHEDILAKIGDRISALCEVDGFHFSRVMQDALHGINLGPAAHLAGGVLEQLAGRNRAGNLLALWNLFSEWCSHNKLACPVPPFTAGMINMATKKTSSPKCPEWKCKAWNCRLVVSWLAFYTLELVGGVKPELRMFNTALSSLSRFFSSMEKNGRFLSREEAEVMKKDGFTFLGAYIACHKWAQEKKLPHFPMKPKFHAFTHMVYDLDNLENPQYAHCFGDEDYMGVIARISKGCHRQTQPTRAMQRLLTAIVMEFTGMND